MSKVRSNVDLWKEMMQAVKVDDMGDADHCSLVKYYEKMSKVEVKR